MIVLELPNDFAELGEEIERQKLALLDKNKRKETMEVSGKDSLSSTIVVMPCFSNR